jgi:hypothetical protein
MPTLKGAFINLGAGVLGALPNIIIFQFNPERVSRTPSLAQPPPRTPVGAGKVDVTQQASGPTESFNFTLQLDASDQRAENNPIAVAGGILPALSALELLQVPQAALDANLASLAALAGGSPDYVWKPSKLPTVLFFWGPFRIWPVTVNSLSITETEYDTLLNPVRAEVNLSLQVLTPIQLLDSKLAQGAYQYSLGIKQVMAALNLANAAQLGLSGGFSLAL